MLDIDVPDSPRSTASSELSDSPRLDPGTLALLQSFLSSKAEEEERFNELEISAGHALLDDDDEGEPISLEKYLDTFREDWQLSQFW